MLGGRPLELSKLIISTWVALLLPVAAQGFPPYRSTDADTAAPWTLEARLGLLKIQHADRQNSYTSPLLRLNFGFTRHFEILSEFEYDIEEGRVGDGAVGFKWAPIQRSISLGIETLMLLPVSSEYSGVGVESQLLATIERDRYQVHVNAGGFYDPRRKVTENGWRASVLTEARFGRFKPGLELFAKQVHHESTQVQAGPGIIFDLGPFEVRSAVHFGLTSSAPDFVTSLWISKEFPLRQGH